MKEHKISLVTAILMNINIMVGSGILIGPGVMAAAAGNASFISWLIVAVLFLPIVLSTVQMSRLIPGSGGFYSYAKAGLNKAAGLWSGLLYMTGYTFAVSVEVLALRKTLFEALGQDWTWFTNTPVLFNAVIVAAIVGLNLLGMRFFSRILNSLTISKIIPLLTLILLLPFIFNPSFTVSSVEIGMLPYSLPMAMFGYFGFEYCCSISHLIEDSERNAPLAILIGFIVTAILYTLFTFSALNLMGPVDLASQGASSFADYLTLPIPYFQSLMKILIPSASAITLFAAAAGLLNANAVMLHSMAERNLFYGTEWLTKLSSSARPYVTVFLFGGLVFLVTVFIPNIPVVGNLCNIGVFLSFILPFVSLIMLQRQQGKTAQILLTVIALLMVIGLSIYILMSLGNSMQERFYNILPFLALFGAGYLLCKGEKNAQEVTR